MRRFRDWEPFPRGRLFRLSMTRDLVTADATRRRAIGHILLLAAGFFVLIAISADSVFLVNKARKDARWVVHTVEVENQISPCCCRCAAPKARSAAISLTCGRIF